MPISPRRIPPAEPVFKWHLGNYYLQVGDVAPPNGFVHVDPQGTLVRYPGRFDEVERAIQHRWPFLKIGFDRIQCQWVWYRTERELIRGPELDHVQDVATIIQGCSDDLWETRKCDRHGTVVHAFREPNAVQDMALLHYIESHHPGQLEPTAGGPWVGDALRKEYHERLARRDKRIQTMTQDALSEWMGFVDKTDFTRFKPSIVVPGRAR